MHNPKEFSMQKDLSHHRLTKVQRGECLTESNEMMGHALQKLGIQRYEKIINKNFDQASSCEDR